MTRSATPGDPDPLAGQILLFPGQGHRVHGRPRDGPPGSPARPTRCRSRAPACPRRRRHASSSRSILRAWAGARSDQAGPRGSAGRTARTSSSWSRRGTARTGRSTGRSAGEMLDRVLTGRVALGPRLPRDVERPQPLERSGTRVAIRSAKTVRRAPRSGESQSPAMYDSPNPMRASAPSRSRKRSGRCSTMTGAWGTWAARPMAVPSGSSTRTSRRRAACSNSRRATRACTVRLSALGARERSGQRLVSSRGALKAPPRLRGSGESVVTARPPVGSGWVAAGSAAGAPRGGRRAT